MKALPSVNLHEKTDAPATIVRSGRLRRAGGGKS